MLSTCLKATRTLTSLDISMFTDALVGSADCITSSDVSSTTPNEIKQGGLVKVLATGAMAVVANINDDGDISLRDTTTVTALAAAINGNRSLTKLTFGGDRNYETSQPVTLSVDMTEADFSGKGLTGPAGMLLASFLPRCRYSRSIRINILTTWCN